MVVYCLLLAVAAVPVEAVVILVSEEEWHPRAIMVPVVSMVLEAMVEA